jgi:hypothetical protein
LCDGIGMGYDVHITRPVNRPLGNKSTIALDEWQRLVNEDPDMQLKPVAEAHSPKGEVIRYENEGLAVWKTHSGNREVWFDYRNGRIAVKNPDDETLAKMRALAAKLEARVRGDEGEFYDD